ncbi:MAG TPA: cytochrome c oxidase assembly protein, partial [Propylenella sp.]|nr:cytochrome c oxidase assembly protein [Propylenella sp.]
MKLAAAILIALPIATPALAHGGDAVGSASLWAEWRPDPLMSILLAGVAAAYCMGLARLWRRAGSGRGVRR